MLSRCYPVETLAAGKGVGGGGFKGGVIMRRPNGCSAFF
jgi:hypothetical protein